MNKLQRDYRRLRLGILLFSFSSCALGALKLIQWTMGLTERQFYARFPLGWYIVVVFGIVFIVGLALAVKKSMDINPNIQLRKMSIDELSAVLNDSGYKPWHATAERVLADKTQKSRITSE